MGKECCSGRALQEKHSSSPMWRSASVPQDSPKGYGTASVATSKVSSVTLQNGLRILNLSLGWFSAAGSELLHLCGVTPHSTKPTSHSPPCASLMPSAPWEKGGSASLRSPKDREEKAEPGAGWFERALTLYTEGRQPQAGALLACKSYQGSHSLAEH